MKIENLIKAYNALTSMEQIEFCKKTGLVLRPAKSTKLYRTGITVSIPAQSGKFTAKQDISKILKLKEDGGLFDSIGHNISTLAYDNNAQYDGCQAALGVVDRFINFTTHRDVIIEGEMFGLYKKYNLWQAALLANELVRPEIIGCIRGNEIIIYLTETIKKKNCALIVKYTYGNIGVDVVMAGPGRGCNKGTHMLSGK